MSSLARFVFCVAASFAVAAIAMPGAQALPIGVKAPRLSQGVILVKRECIAYKRRPDGTSVCVRWAECGKTVC